MKTLRPAVLLGILVCIWHAAAYPYFKDILPNGNEVPHPCKANYLWHGVGHKNALGGGDRNQFGLDFKAADYKWTTELCNKDSDGDGMTNGQELGDPGCVWSPGSLPSRITDITHPGVCTLQDGSICEKESWIDCKVADGLKNCDALKEPETRNMTVRFPETQVPAVETSYMCMVFNLPTDTDYHLVAYEPYIDNQDVMHHIILYGCDPNEDLVPDNELNTVKPCGMGAGKKCTTIIGLWAVGFTGYCLDGPMGFKFGASGYKQAAIEFHWNNPQNVASYNDSSGMTLFYTPKLRTNDAGILMTGQNFLEIPPGESSYTAVGTCHSNCSRVLMQGPINVFWATNHMHYLGHEMTIEVFRDGQFYTELTNDEIYNYDSPVEYKYTTAVQVLPGDEIVTTCKFKSLSRPKTTFYGDATSDEMCFGFLAFYPASNMVFPGCTAWKGISVCNLWLTRKHEGCQYDEFMDFSNNKTKAVVDLVNENCKAFGNCLKECKSVLERLMAEHPCMSGDVYDLIRKLAVDYNHVEMRGFLAAVDSCKVEMAPTATRPTEDTSRSSYLGAFYWVSLSLAFITLMINY